MNKRLYDLPVEKRRKEFQKIKRKVLKKYPNATTRANTDGTFYLSDGYGGVIGEDYMLPPTKSVWMAWEHALRYGIQLHQNLLRTHPSKMSGDRVEAKIMRINRRRGDRHKE
jgi:hypothetical protein